MQLSNEQMAINRLMCGNTARGREYVSNYGKCPMCMDCSDGCPLKKEGE